MHGKPTKANALNCIKQKFYKISVIYNNEEGHRIMQKGALLRANKIYICNSIKLKLKRNSQNNALKLIFIVKTPKSCIMH